MMDYLILGLAVIGAWWILRICWRLGKILTAIWRLRKMTLRWKQFKRDNPKIAISAPEPVAWVRNQVTAAMVAKVMREYEQEQTTSHPWSKEEQDRAN